MSGKKDEGHPADTAAESAIIGSIFLDNEVFFEQIGELRAQDFHLDSNQKIFRAINDIMFGMVEKTHRVDIVTVAAELKSRGELNAVGGIAYLCHFTEGLPRNLHIEEYVAIVREMSKRRMLMQAGHELYKGAIGNFADSGTLIERMEERLTEVVADEKGDAVRIGEITGAIQEGIFERRNIALEQTNLGMTWGFEPLDVKTKGAFGGELTVVAGDSGGYKTQFVIQMILENALKGIPGMIFSMEMSKEKLAQRIYPLLSETITANLMRDPRGMNLHTHVPEMKRLTELVAKLPIWIDDTSPLTLQKMVARSRMMIRKHKIKLIAADYLQLLQLPGKTGVDKTETVMFGVRDFMKTESGLHMVLLSQYAKEQGFARKRRRTKGDLYGGAVIHQAAQNVLLLTVENPDKKEYDENLDGEIMIDKQREGAPGKVICSLERTSLKFIPREEVTEKKDDTKSAANKQPGRSKSTGHREPEAGREGD